MSAADSLNRYFSGSVRFDSPYQSLCVIGTSYAMLVYNIEPNQIFAVNNNKISTLKTTITNKLI